MSVHKQSVSFTNAAFAYAKELVARGDYWRARASREREQALLEAEITRRLALPLDQWEPVGSLDALTADAFARIEQLERQDEATANRD